MKTKNTQRTIDLKDSLNKVKIPIITVDIESKQYNFIIDTGSDSSYIDCNSIEDIKSKELVGEQGCVISATGTNDNSIPIYDIKFSCCDHEFHDYFSINNFSDSFNFIEQSYNIRLHGILGCEFLDKNKCIIDFKDKLFYI